MWPLKLVPFAVMVFAFAGVLLWFWMLLSKTKRMIGRLMAAGRAHESRNEADQALAQYKLALASVLGVGEGNEQWGLKGVVGMMKRFGWEVISRMEAIYQKRNLTLEIDAFRSRVSEYERLSNDKGLTGTNGLPSGKALEAEARMHAEVKQFYDSLP
jgi:hypothetical protein